MKDLVCLGEILVDMFPAELGRRLTEVTAFIPKPGGAPANVAVAAARLGARSAFIGKVGDDAFGRYLVRVLDEQDVDSSGMRFDPEARTTMAFIAKPDENTSEFVFYRNPGADTRLEPDELDRVLLSGTRAFHFGSLSLTDEPARAAAHDAAHLARQHGVLVSFDVNYRPSLWRDPEMAVGQVMSIIPKVNLLKVNEMELELVSGSSDLDRGSQAILEMGPALCVVTLGPKGSYYRSEEGGEFVPGFTVKTVDSTGCGDAFVAGLLWKLVKDGDWRRKLDAGSLHQTLRYANAVGALTAQSLGVIPALPTSSQVEEFLINFDS